jgi:glutamate carboxypeptidase
MTRMHRSTLARTRPLIAALLCCVAAQALALDAKEKRIVRAVDARQAQALGLLAETVDIDSATENHAGVRKVGVVLARELAELGFETRWADVPAPGEYAEVDTLLTQTQRAALLFYRLTR